MTLSAANVIQAKTGVNASSVAPEVVLDAGTQDGSTVTIELYAGGVPFTDSGLGGRVPDGFETDVIGVSAAGAKLAYVFRKRNVAAGEGVAGSTGWIFGYLAPNYWSWRVTEWDTSLEPVFPLEAFSFGTDQGTSPTSLSTGTTPTTSRSDLVCLAWHQWTRPSTTAQSMTFSGHTNGFTVRDQNRWSGTNKEVNDCWSWLFSASAAAFETTATINLTTRDTQDLYVALLVVYAATTYE
jgi:hypothetical protein